MTADELRWIVFTHHSSDRCGHSICSAVHVSRPPIHLHRSGGVRHARHWPAYVKQMGLGVKGVFHRDPSTLSEEDRGVNRHLLQGPNNLLHPLSAPPPEMEAVRLPPLIKVAKIGRQVYLFPTLQTQRVRFKGLFGFWWSLLSVTLESVI